MARLKLGVSLESFNLPLRRALKEAQQLGVSGVKIDAVGELSPAKLSQTGRRELRHLLKIHDVELTALGCPLRHGLDTAENLQPRIEHVQQVMSLAYDLGPRVVLVQAGQVPEKDDDPRMTWLKESLSALGLYGDRVGTTLALETGLESGAVLSAFLKRFDTGSLGVNFDPANLLMHGFQPFEDLRSLAGLIKHVQAKDARRSSPSRAAQEVPLGHGDLDWMGLCEMLTDSEYHGWLVVVRDGGNQRVQDMHNGVGYLRRFI